MNTDKFTQSLREKLDALPREIQPQRDLWPGIDLAIEENQQRLNSSRHWAGIAASIGILGLAGLLALNVKLVPDSNTADLRPLAKSMSVQHTAQMRLLLAGYDKQPALTNNWQGQLQELENAATLIRSALGEDPGDARLIKLLRQVYQQQIKLIQSVHQSRWL